VKTILAAATILFLSACATNATRSNDLHANSVKVTNMQQNHGGSGIVLLSTDTNSYVLTNSHVCGVVEKGGVVAGPAGTHMVTGYKKSQNHDLCLIRVSANLGVDTNIANRPPRLYYEDASISGHPALMPNLLSKGRFSGKEIIQVLAGVRPCTDADAQDPEKALICALLGGIPVVKNYESTLVSATIMPGSSGSGVYNSDGDLSGVAFAGSGQLGYAWTVPYEDMRNFIFKEAPTLGFEKPDTNVSLFDEADSHKGLSEVQFLDRLKKVCSTASREKIKDLCQLADTSVLR
jgi:hypothetical protein